MRHIQDPNTLQGFPHDCLFLEMWKPSNREFYPQSERLRTSGTTRIDLAAKICVTFRGTRFCWLHEAQI